MRSGYDPAHVRKPGAMMATRTMTLTDFLLRRLTDDERVAEAVPEVEAKSRTAIFTSLSEPTGTVEMSPTRVLAECAAKRRIVEAHHPSGEYEPDACVLCQWDVDCEAPRQDTHLNSGHFPCLTLRALAAVYADHSDYRDEWRP